MMQRRDLAVVVVCLKSGEPVNLVLTKSGDKSQALFEGEES